MVESQAPDRLPADPQVQAQIQETLNELLGLGSGELQKKLSQDNFSLPEIVLLAEYLVQQPYDPAFNRLMQAFEKYIQRCLPTWKHAEDSKTLDRLQKRFDDALIAFKKARQTYEEQGEAAAQEARALLAELKKIVEGEQIDAQGRVRAIASKWRQLRPHILRKDRKELIEAFKNYFLQFDQIYERYKDILEQERASFLEQRRRIIEEIQALFPPEDAKVSAEFWQQQRDRLALLQREWQALPFLRTREEAQLAKTYRELVRKFRETYTLFRSQVYQRIQKNQVLFQAYQRKKQIIELLTPLVEREYKSLEEWRGAQKQVRELILEWRRLTEATLAQDDSKEVRRHYSALNQRFGELLDQFYEKSEHFSREYRLQQIRRLKEQGQSILSQTEKLLKKDLAEAWRHFHSYAMQWRRRAQRFSKEPDIQRLYEELQAMRQQLIAARKAREKVLNENLERRIHLLNELDQLSDAAKPAPLEAYLEKLLSYEQAGEVAPSAQERLNHRLRQAIQRYLQATGMAEAAFQEAWLKAQVARQSPQEIQKTLQSLKAQLKRFQSELNGYQNTLALLAKGKSSEPLRQELNQKIIDTQNEIARLEQTIKQLKALASSANASPSASA